jgi:hypothetical protein
VFHYKRKKELFFIHSWQLFIINLITSPNFA